jgi:hypothetical protein
MLTLSGGCVFHGRTSLLVTATSDCCLGLFGGFATVDCAALLRCFVAFVCIAHSV